MSIREFDAIIIGAGQAGPPLAGRLNDVGMKVAIIERHLVGGTCVNTGCKPTKTLVASAYAEIQMSRYGGVSPFFLLFEYSTSSISKLSTAELKLLP